MRDFHAIVEGELRYLVQAEGLVLALDFEWVASVEAWSEGRVHFVEDHPQAEDVALLVVHASLFAVFEDLGRHVARRAALVEDVALLLDARGEAEVDDHELVIFGVLVLVQDVLGFEVAMHDTLGWRKLSYLLVEIADGEEEFLANGLLFGKRHVGGLLEEKASLKETHDHLHTT